MSRSRVRCGNRECVAALGRVKRGGTALRVAAGVTQVEAGHGVVELQCAVCGRVRRFRVKDLGDANDAIGEEARPGVSAPGYG